MGDKSEFNLPRSGQKGDFTLVIRRSTNVKFAILSSKAPKGRFYVGHSPFDHTKIRHLEFRVYITRHIQRSTNVHVPQSEGMRGRLLVPKRKDRHRMGGQRQQSSMLSAFEARGCRLLEALGHIHYLSPIATNCFPISSTQVALCSNGRCPSVMSICRSTHVKIAFLNPRPQPPTHPVFDQRPAKAVIALLSSEATALDTSSARTNAQISHFERGIPRQHVSCAFGSIADPSYPAARPWGDPVGLSHDQARKFATTNPPATISGGQQTRRGAWGWRGIHDIHEQTCIASCSRSWECKLRTSHT